MDQKKYTMKPTEKIEKVMRDGLKSKKALQVFDQTKTLPFDIPLYQLVEFASIIQEIKTIIKRSKNPRTIVLETWLILDFCIRDLILAGFELKRFQTGFDVLPNSLNACFNILQNLRKDQLKRLPNPMRNFVRFPSAFFDFLSKEFPEDLTRIGGIEIEYYKKIFPEALSPEVINYVDNPEYRSVSDTWIKVIAPLDDKWFKEASRLNLSRNEAAHSLDNEKIFEKMGINGSTKQIRIDKLKETCIDLLNRLMGIRK